jgi:26S proteasome regulatory subunit N2
MDNAVSGEAAGLAIGLVMLGSAPQHVLEELIRYAHETQHEKIIRGIAVGVALMMLGKEEEADELIEQLKSDKVSCLQDDQDDKQLMEN